MRARGEGRTAAELTRSLNCLLERSSGWITCQHAVQGVYCLGLLRAATVDWMQCEARVRRGLAEPAEPGLFPRRYIRAAESFVCGIAVCDQHRRIVTAWIDGVEQLNDAAQRIFARWRVEPRGPFVPEDEQEPIPVAPFFPVA
jgi:hypothetical protein